MTVLKYDDVIKKAMQSWLPFLYFLKNIIVLHTCKVSSQGVTGSELMTEKGAFWRYSVYLMQKSPDWLG